MKRIIILSIISVAIIIAPVFTLSAQDDIKAGNPQTSTTTQSSTAGGGGLDLTKQKKVRGQKRSGNRQNQQSNQNQDSIIEDAGFTEQTGQGDYPEDDENFVGAETETGKSGPGTNVQKTNVVGTYNDNQFESQPASSGNELEWFTLIVALAALGMSAYNYYYLHSKRDKKLSQQERRHEQAILDERQRLQNVIKQNQILSDNINKLNLRIDDLCKSMSLLQSQALTHQSQSIVHETNSKNNEIRKDSRILLFASTVTGDGFPDDSISKDNSAYVIAQLTVNGETGSFIINDFENAQSFLISNFAYGAGRVCDIQRQVSSPVRVNTVRPGEVRHQGNAWKIVSKALVELV